MKVLLNAVDKSKTKLKTVLVPADQTSQDYVEKRFKPGVKLECSVVVQRNPAFHRKMFSLFNVGFKYWEPGEVSSKYGKPEKNFDQFRADCTILAGYYEVVTRLNGDVRVVPKSIAFGSMEQEDFEKLYSAVIDVLLKNIFTGMKSEEIIAIAEQEILNFC